MHEKQLKLIKKRKWNQSEYNVVSIKRYQITLLNSLLFLRFIKQYRIVIKLFFMFSPTKIGEILVNLEVLFQQNKEDISMLNEIFLSPDKLLDFTKTKLSLFQDIISIAIAAVAYIQTCFDQQQDLELKNNQMKKDMHKLCGINLTLEDQIERLSSQLGSQQQQLHSALKNQQILELERTVIQQQLQSLKSKIKNTLVKKNSEDFRKITTHIPQREQVERMRLKEITNEIQLTIKGHNNDRFFKSINYSLYQEQSLLPTTMTQKTMGFEKELSDNLQQFGDESSICFRNPIKLNEDLDEVFQNQQQKSLEKINSRYIENSEQDEFFSQPSQSMHCQISMINPKNAEEEPRQIVCDQLLQDDTQFQSLSGSSQFERSQAFSIKQAKGRNKNIRELLRNFHEFLYRNIVKMRVDQKTSKAKKEFYFIKYNQFYS